MTRPLLLSILTAALSSLSAWGDELQPPEADRRPTSEVTGAYADEPELPLVLPGTSAVGASEPAAPRVWTLSELRQACNAYTEWDAELEDCVRTEVPLPPELEFFEPLGRPLVRPPGGVIVLHPDGTWTEEDACPPELLEEMHVNNWRFCRDPERNDTIPKMWTPPINEIPYEEVGEIFAANQDALMAIDGVSGVGLSTIGIIVYTFKPELVPETVEGVPIILLEPVFGTPLSHTESVPWRPLKAAAGMIQIRMENGEFGVPSHADDGVSAPALRPELAEENSA